MRLTLFAAFALALPSVSFAQAFSPPGVFAMTDGEGSYFIGTRVETATNGDKRLISYFVPVKSTGWSQTDYLVRCPSRELSLEAVQSFGTGGPTSVKLWLHGAYRPPASSWDSVVYRFACLGSGANGRLVYSLSDARTLMVAQVSPPRPAPPSPVARPSVPPAPAPTGSVTAILSAALDKDANARWKKNAFGVGNTLLSGGRGPATMVSNKGWEAYSVYQLDYRYLDWANNTQRGWVRGMFRQGQLYCIQFHDFPRQCRLPGGNVLVDKSTNGSSSSQTYLERYEQCVQQGSAGIDPRFDTMAWDSLKSSCRQWAASNP